MAQPRHGSLIPHRDSPNGTTSSLAQLMTHRSGYHGDTITAVAGHTWVPSCCHCATGGLSWPCSCNMQTLCAIKMGTPVRNDAAGVLDPLDLSDLLDLQDMSDLHSGSVGSAPCVPVYGSRSARPVRCQLLQLLAVHQGHSCLAVPFVCLTRCCRQRACGAARGHLHSSHGKTIKKPAGFVPALGL